MNELTKRRIEAQVKLILQSPMKHKILIRNLAVQDLHLTGDHYIFELKKKNKIQLLTVKLIINKSIIEDREDVKRDIARIIFNEAKFNIIVERNYSFQNIKKENDRYTIKYKSNQFQFNVEVSHEFQPSYYEQAVLRRIAIRKKPINKKKQNSRPKNVKKKKVKPNEYLLRKDFYDSDLYRYTYSQNSDGNRSYREVFGGDFANYRRRK